MTILSERRRAIEGRTVLVTGANRGLGAAMVAAAIERGAAKVYAGARDLASFGTALDRFQGRAVPVQLDVTSDEEVARAGETLADVDLVISNAGVTYMVPLMETTIAGARATMEVNYFGPLRLVHAFGRALDAKGGGFISILSLAGVLPAGNAELYSASKAAGKMLGHAITHALPNVALSMSFPGLMDTDMMRDTPLKKTSAEEIAARTLDGWAAGEVSIFPDLHAEYVRDEYLAHPPATLADPYPLMGAAIGRYIAERGAA